jgi:DNA-binding LacI/PurR family transcriptional regulator
VQEKKPGHERLDRLMTLVEQDIQSRGLQVGDRYLTTQEVAGLFRVSTRTANDALQILAEKKVVERRPKAGTTIGPNAAASPPPVFDVVHLLVRQNYFFANRKRLESVVTGLARELPGTAMQFSFVPSFSELVYVQRLIRLNTAGGMKTAYLIAVKSPELQDFFRAAKVPAVLLGTPFPGVVGLPYLDKDQREIGRLLTQRLIELGHRRFGVILRERRGYGDDLLVDGITHEVLGGHLGKDALVIRSAPLDEELACQTALTLLNRVPRPTAIICRTQLIHDAATKVCETIGLRVDKDVCLALCDPAAETEGDNLPPTCLRLKAQNSTEAEGRIIGKMLSAMAHGEPPVPDHHITPVSLH